MLFTKSLYYPSIDIQDEEWLKSAILFWDEINTIVPASIKNPYTSYSSQYLNYEGIVKPIVVDPSDKYVKEIGSNIWKFLNSDAGYKVINNFEYGITSHQSSAFRALLHTDKISPILIRRIREFVKFIVDENGFYELDPGFVSFYMTLLANSISEDKSLALITNNSLNFRFSETLRFDSNTCELNDYYATHITKDIILKQGILTNFVIDNIKISESTTLQDILEFKKYHRDELARFRVNLSKLVDSVNNVLSFEALNQSIQAIYSDELLPAYNDLKKALNYSKIKWISDNISKLCVFSVSTTAVPALLGVGIPQAVFLGAGVSVVSSAIAYNVDKTEKLRKNPYTYLLEVDKNLS